MNCTLGRLQACLFRSSYLLFFDAGGSSLPYIQLITSPFFCFRIMNRSIRLFCGRTQAKPGRHINSKVRTRGGGGGGGGEENNSIGLHLKTKGNCNKHLPRNNTV